MFKTSAKNTSATSKRVTFQPEVNALEDRVVPSVSRCNPAPKCDYDRSDNYVKCAVRQDDCKREVKCFTRCDTDNYSKKEVKCSNDYNDKREVKCFTRCDDKNDCQRYDDCKPSCKQDYKSDCKGGYDDWCGSSSSCKPRCVSKT